MTYQDHILKTRKLIESKKGSWDGISAEAVARMRLQNRFKTGLDIARYTRRTVILRDGKILTDEKIADRLSAENELKKLRVAQEAVKLA